MTLETKRLELLRLDADQMALLSENCQALERALNFRYDAEPLKGEFLEVLGIITRRMREKPEEAQWNGLWLILRKSDRVAVGSADFKGAPNARGEEEIGYGLGPAHRHLGYMTETVQAMCAWALRQPGVSAVIAETLRENAASQAVLHRAGFQLFREAETFWWRLD